MSLVSVSQLVRDFCKIHGMLFFEQWGIILYLI